MTIGSLLAASNLTTLNFDFTTPGGSGDLLIITSGLTLAPDTAITFGTLPTTYGDYRLIGYGSVTGDLSDFDLPGAPPNTMYTLSTTVDPGYIDLVVAVPEPSTLVLLGVGALGLLGCVPAAKTRGIVAMTVAPGAFFPANDIITGIVLRLFPSPETRGMTMALTVKKITLWRGEVEDKPGTLGKVLGPLAGAGADLQVVMGYHYHGGGNKAAIEVSPVKGKKAATAAEGAGLLRLVDSHAAGRGGQQGRFGGGDCPGDRRGGNQHRLPGSPGDRLEVLCGDRLRRQGGLARSDRHHQEGGAEGREVIGVLLHER